MSKTEYPVLRFIVIAMGALLIVGTITLFGIVIKRVISGEDIVKTYSVQNTDKTKLEKQDKIISASNDSCVQNKNLPLEKYGRLVSLHMENDIARIVMQNNQHYNIVTVNSCTGEIYGVLGFSVANE